MSGILRSIADVRGVGPSRTLADGRRVIDQEWVQVHLARVRARAEYLKLINWKVAWAADKGLNPADASATKVFGTEFALEAYRLLMEVVGQAGLPARGVARVRCCRAGSSSGSRSQTIFTFGGRHQRDPAGHHRHDRSGHAPGPALTGRGSPVPRPLPAALTGVAAERHRRSRSL